MNLKIKYRESFRPFAPAILEEQVASIYEQDLKSPYMLLVANKKQDSLPLPAVTHVDQSARLQTVNEKENGLFYHLIREFNQATGCPVLVNTSFNVRGEPVVCSPQDALRCFVNTEMDCLYLGSYRIDRKDQCLDRKDPRWKVQLELD